jgi:hypothetical protein
MRIALIILSTIAAAACEPSYVFNITSPTTVPGSTPGISINNTNTNTNNESDRSDTGSDDDDNDDDDNGNNNISQLPLYGESVTRSVASRNSTLLANSCQDKFGEIAWQFLDKVISELRQHSGDSRWGYLCKDTSCSKTARDIVAYRASMNNTGIWIVDVIGNHCPLAGEIPEVRWGVLPFEVERSWSSFHH